MNIPYLDLRAHHESRRSEFSRAIEEVISASAFAGGAVVERFERQFASYCDCTEAIGVGSGTEALWLVLQSLEIGPGDEVITVPMTFIATAEAITQTGATPVFVDVDEESYTMSPSELQKAITPRTKAIVPVHLYGQMADMDPILELARKHDLYVVEDAAQAHGARYKGRLAGSMGDAGCFSFYPGKNLGAFGDAGAIVTRNADLARKIRMRRDHGQDGKNVHRVSGWNCRMDGIQAAVLEIKLRDLDVNNERRAEVAAIYDRFLLGLKGVIRPCRERGRQHVYHIYAIRTRERARVIDQLEKREIGYGIHYPVPLHLQEAHEYLGYRAGDLPVSERCADEVLSLPMYPELTSGQVASIAEAVQDAVSDTEGNWEDWLAAAEASRKQSTAPNQGSLDSATH